MHLLLSGGAGSVLDRWGMYSNQQNYPEIHMTLDYYVYSIVDVDCDNKSWNIKTYSLGNPDNIMDNELIDEWYCKLNQQKPNTPTAISIENQGTVNAELLASIFSGVDSLMTSQFQLTETIGDYSNPILDVTRDWHNIYGDSGAPNYTPIDLNAGIELNKLNVDGYVTGTQMYGWRVRYRDFNLKWSDWSNEFIINDTATVSQIVDNNNFNVKISPNPTNNKISINYNLVKNEVVTISIFDNSGKIITTITSNENQKEGEYSFEYHFNNSFDAGVYYCNFNFSGKIISKAIVLK